MKTLETLAAIGVLSIMYWTTKAALKVKDFVDSKKTA